MEAWDTNKNCLSLILEATAVLPFAFCFGLATAGRKQWFAGRDRVERN
jgi:hypothetical protein